MPEVIPHKTIETLDLIFVNGKQRHFITGELGADVSPLEGVLLQLVPWDDKTRPVENPMVIGAVLTENPANGYFPSPVFSEGKIEPKILNPQAPKTKSLEGLHAFRIKEGHLILKHSYAGIIDVDENGKCSVYLGHAGFPEELPAIVFDNPLVFDPKKLLVYVRSPNGSRDFSEVLHHREIREGQDRADEYLLIYESLAELKTGRWARNHATDDFYEGIDYEHNEHLKLSK